MARVLGPKLSAAVKPGAAAWWRASWAALPSLLLGAGLAACTPLGLWLYSDPSVTVAKVTLEVSASSEVSASRRPVVVALAVQNPNDYVVAATHLEVALRLDGVPIGQLVRDSTVPLPETEVSTVALPMALSIRATPERLRAFQSGMHSYVVEGRAVFDTPIGKRRVRFAEEGTMAFGGMPGWTGGQGGGQ